MKFLNMMLEREEPSETNALKIRKQGEVVVEAVREGASNEDITPYFHSLVCAIPRQARKHEHMDLSGQALENLNQHLKKNSASKINRRYSVNTRTGAIPAKAMSVGMTEQL